MQKIKLTNWFDGERARRGEIDEDAVRSMEVDALADTGAATLVLPANVADRLGLSVLKEGTAYLTDGSSVPTRRVGTIRLEILGRDMVTSALVMPMGTMPLIGQIPLVELDLIVEPRNQSLRLNPDNPDWVVRI